MEARKSTAFAVKSRIDTFENGFIFSYMDFDDPRINKEAIIKALNRLKEKGIIHKFSKGKFYKSDITGNIIHAPNESEIIKDLLEKNGQVIGYKTGWRIFNKNEKENPLSKTIFIGRNDFKPPLERGIYSIKFIVQKNKITKNNIKLLQVLDCLRMVRKIQDSSGDNLFSIIGKAVRKFNKQEKETLLEFALKYPPSTRALLTKIFEVEKIRGNMEALQESLNPISTFNKGLKEIENFFREKWGIK